MNLQEVDVDIQIPHIPVKHNWINKYGKYGQSLVQVMVGFMAVLSEAFRDFLQPHQTTVETVPEDNPLPPSCKCPSICCL